jgi:hypothetical protein
MVTMAVDHFATLGLPRRADLSEDHIQEAFVEMSRGAHPDQAGGDLASATAVNEAHGVLTRPELRIKHLLELSGQSDWKAVPLDESFMSVFSRISSALPRAQDLAGRAAKSQSALSKALLASEEMQLREELEAVGTEVAGLRDPLLARLPEMDRRIDSGEAAVWEELHTVQAKLSYTFKWQAQIREALLQLTTLLA